MNATLLALAETDDHVADLMELSGLIICAVLGITSLVWFVFFCSQRECPTCRRVESWCHCAARTPQRVIVEHRYVNELPPPEADR